MKKHQFDLPTDAAAFKIFLDFGFDSPEDMVHGYSCHYTTVTVAAEQVAEHISMRVKAVIKVASNLMYRLV